MKKNVLFLLLLLGVSTTLFAQVDKVNPFKNTQVDPSVEITFPNIGATSVQINFVPNESCEYYYFVAGPKGQMEAFATQFGTTIDELVTQWGIQQFGEYTHEYTDFSAGTEYEIFVRPYGSNDTPFPLVKAEVTTITLGGDGVSEITIELSNITSNSVILKTTPNAETSVYYNGLAELALVETEGVEGAMNMIIANDYALYAVDIWEWLSLKENTKYKALARGKNANGEWGPIAEDEFATLPTGIDEVSANKDFSIHPNPSDGNFTLTSKLDSNLKGKLIDSAGKLLQEVEIRSGENAFSFNNLSAGIYWMVISNENATVVTAPIIIAK